MRNAMLILLCCVTGCASASRRQNDYQTVIREELQQMLDAWNRDDVDAHIAFYADSATWMTSTGLLRGRDAIRATLIKSFQRDHRLLGDLSFADTEFHPLGANTVMTTGGFRLTNLPSGRDLTGRATLIWVRAGARWLIVHDHSS